MNIFSIRKLAFFLFLLSNFQVFAITKTVGNTGANYSTLKSAFDAINAGTLTGVVTLQVIANTTETSAAILNASGTYTSVNIYPKNTGLSITGNLATPLIDLNGASNVIIDGRVNASGSTKDLTINNTSISGTAGTSTIRLYNGANTNTIKYCIVKGSETVTTSGIISISASAFAAGNNNNTIDNNNVTSSSDANRPINAIYSSSGSAFYENSGNIVSNNNFYNFLKHATTSNGIYLAANNNTWTISGNNFYETTTFIPSAGGSTYNIIQINNAGSGYNISGNFIGGQAIGCGGSAWTKTNAQSNPFVAINMNVATGSASNIQGNTIQNFAWSNNTGASSWTGINITTGDVNVGTISGNTLGASSEMVQ